MSVATYTRLKMSPKSHLNSTFVLAGIPICLAHIDLRSPHEPSAPARILAADTEDALTGTRCFVSRRDLSSE